MLVSSRKRLLIVGHGMAATRLVRDLEEKSPGQFAITIVGDEKLGGYNRVLLSSLLAGESDEAALAMQDRSWYRQHDIQLIAGDAVSSIELDTQSATTESGRKLNWDYLVLATGSRAARLPIPGTDLDGVMTLRTLQEAKQLIARSRDAGNPESDKNAVVVGGGLLGLEAACALQARGMQVTVVHNESWPMNRQLDGEAGELLRRTLQQRGIGFNPEANCVRFEADAKGETVSALLLADGRRLPCTTAVMALGIIPEVSLARQLDLVVERAIVVDKWLQTSDERVFALGECCQIESEMFGLVAPIYQQADILSAVLLYKATTGTERISPDVDDHASVLPHYQRQPLPTRLKVSGVDVFSAGMLASPDNSAPLRSMAMRDGRTGHYRRLWWRGSQLVGAVMFGDIGDSSHYLRMIEDGCKADSNPATLLAPSSRAAS